MPTPAKYTVHDGYLYLTASWAKLHPKFYLYIPLVPRIVTPHPFANQDVIALARGPIIYCLEDEDNEWVTDHFKVRIMLI
jgi:DUF1680 family protein